MAGSKIEFTREKFDKRIEELKRNKKGSKGNVGARSFSVKEISAAWKHVVTERM